MNLDDIKAEIPDDYWDRVNQKIIAKINNVLLSTRPQSVETTKELATIHFELGETMDELRKLNLIWHDHLKDKPKDS